jgi:hypothetical protein
MSGSQPHKVPPEVDAIFKKLDSFLSNDDEQNKRLPKSFQGLIVGGVACDELPNAMGEFGRTATNPIPTNGPLGEVLYLSKLRTVDDSPVMFHRVRSEKSASNTVDVYEVLSLDGKNREILYLSMCHPRKSRKTPSGYTFASTYDPSNFPYGVNFLVPNFPQELDTHIRKWQTEILGIPLPVTRVREAIGRS